MKKYIQTIALALGTFITVHAQTVMVGGEAMYPKKNIIENAVNSKDHTTLVAAVKAAGLVDALQGKGPFTVFAPVNAAFAALPEGTVSTLLKPENKAMLSGILTYHVAAGNWDANAMMKEIKKGNGKAEVNTLAGGKLWLKMNGERNIQVVDEKGNAANISVYDVYQSNGIIHSIDKVMMPK